MLELIVLWLIVNTVLTIIALARSRRRGDGGQGGDYGHLQRKIERLEKAQRDLEGRLYALSTRVDTVYRLLERGSRPAEPRVWVLEVEMSRKFESLERQMRELRSELQRTVDSVLKAYEGVVRRLGAPNAEVERLLALIPRDKRLLLIDGSNVARQAPGGKPTARNLELAVEWGKSAGFHPVILIERGVLRAFDDQRLIQQLRRQGHLYPVHPPFEVDEVILELAERLNAYILSNDSYSEYRQRYPWIDQRRYAFFFIEDGISIFRPSEVTGGERTD